MVDRLAVADELAGLALFGDLNAAQLEGVEHIFEEQWFPEGTRILRQGLTGSGFYVLLEGEAAVRADDRDISTLGRGDFFGDISALLGVPPTADVVALRPVRCLHLAASELPGFLQAYPPVMYRMLLDQTRRVRSANRWRA